MVEFVMSDRRGKIPANLRGRVFGRLTVLELSHQDKHGKYFWWVQCSCGSKSKTLTASHLMRGATRSCGCLRRETNRTHGDTYSSEWRAWRAMNGRCTRGYRRCCERWRGGKNYPAFLADMGRKPEPKDLYSIDRIDGLEHYSCGHCDECIREGWKPNCRWATKEEQANNRINNHKVKLPDGRELNIAQLARELNLSPYAARQRLLGNATLTAEESLTLTKSEAAQILRERKSKAKSLRLSELARIRALSIQARESVMSGALNLGYTAVWYGDAT